MKNKSYLGLTSSVEKLENSYQNKTRRLGKENRKMEATVIQKTLDIVKLELDYRSLTLNIGDIAQ